MLKTLRIGSAAIWIVFGLIFKLLDFVPRHRLIVATILGESIAGPLILAIGAAEIAMGIWIISGRYPRSCAAAQTIAIVSMNAIEITFAKDLLLSPIGMVAANILFLAVAWYIAGHSSRKVGSI